MLPQTAAGMQALIIKNPILADLEILESEFEEIAGLKASAKFCVFNTNRNKKISNYTYIPIRMGKDNTIDVGDVKNTCDVKTILSVAANCDLVALIVNGPEQPSLSLIKTVAKQAVGKNKLERMIHDNGNFYSYQEVIAYLGVAVVKHAYFWSSHEYCLHAAGHVYYKNIEHGKPVASMKGDNIYDYSMNHELCFGEGGIALMRMLEVNADHYEHFISMLYSRCDSFDDSFRKSVTSLSLNYEMYPFKITNMINQITIARLHTHEHYMYKDHQELIEKFKAGKVKIIDDE